MAASEIRALGDPFYRALNPVRATAALGPTLPSLDGVHSHAM